MFRVATRFRVARPVVAERVMGASTTMSPSWVPAPVVVTVTSVPASSSELIVVLRIVELSPDGVQKSPLGGLLVIAPLAEADVIVTLYGSNSHSPDTPMGADASPVTPSTSKFAPEVSIRPPSPP